MPYKRARMVNCGLHYTELSKRHEFDPQTRRGRCQLHSASGGGRITRVGKMWAKRFQKRHPELKRRRQRTLASERKDAFNIEELELYFAQLKHVCETFGIQIPDRWNMDEIGFRIGCGRSRLVIIVEPDGAPKEPPRIADPDNREHLTDVECVNAEGEAIQPMLISRGSTLLNRYSANSLHREVLQGYSESGYINDDLAIEWMHHFIKCIEKKRVEEWTLLLLDGFVSHSSGSSPSTRKSSSSSCLPTLHIYCNL